MALNIFKMFRKTEEPEETPVPVSTLKNESTDRMIEHASQFMYSNANQIDESDVDMRISFRSRLAHIYNILALKNAMKSLEAKGLVVSMDALVPLSYGGIAVLDYQNPEASIIPAEFDTELPDILNTETLIRHSAKVNNNVKDALGGR